jgi:hypothetical protein
MPDNKPPNPTRAELQHRAQEAQQLAATRQASASAKLMVDNHDFNVLMSYAKGSVKTALLEGPIIDAEANLLTYKALDSVQTLVENLAANPEDT